MTNITSVTVVFGNGQKREEYGPTKKSEVSITAGVAEDEDGEAVLDQISTLAIAKVAAMLDAPKPASTTVANDSQEETEKSPVGEAPARRTRGPNKPKPEPAAEVQPTEEPQPEPTPSDTSGSGEDEWAADPAGTEITDAELLSATSKRAGELGAREPIVKLIASFATRTEGAPFKVQEIPQSQRKDYLTKLAALTA
jgi:hypothetical protein